MLKLNCKLQYRALQFYILPGVVGGNIYWSGYEGCRQAIDIYHIYIRGLFIINDNVSEAGISLM